MKTAVLVLACSLLVASSAVAQSYPAYPAYPASPSIYPALVVPLLPVPLVALPQVPVYRPAPVAPGPPAIIAADGRYLGRLSSNQFDPQSVSNPFGKYGSPFSPTSITNPFSPYGSPFSPLSPTNPFATTPPILVAPSRIW